MKQRLPALFPPSVSNSEESSPQISPAIDLNGPLRLRKGQLALPQLLEDLSLLIYGRRCRLLDDNWRRGLPFALADIPTCTATETADGDCSGPRFDRTVGITREA